MRRLVWLSVAMAASAAVGPAQTAGFAQKAQQDFERVDGAALPAIQDALACSQSHAALLATALADQRFVAHYRKGYCELFAATLTRDAQHYRSAVSEFVQAIANWPPRLRPINPQGIRILAAIAKLEGGRAANPQSLAAELEQAVGAGECPRTPIINDAFCRALVDAGRTWLAWLNLQKGDLEEAVRFVRPLPETPWGIWMAGEQARVQKKNEEALAAFDKAIRAFSAAESSPNPDVITLLGPKPDLGRQSFQVGQAHMGLGKWDRAIPNFDAALKADSTNSLALFLRAQAKEQLGLAGPALADYAAAAEMARLQGDTRWGEAEAFFRRGLIHYRAKEYSRARSEFSTAQSARPGSLHADNLTAWRVMAEVAAGSCDTAAGLANAMKATNDEFPKAEATAWIVHCQLKLAQTIEQLEAVERDWGKDLSPQQATSLRERISAAWADSGAAAEDRKEPAKAVDAYRSALRWNPRNLKARFNLGALYVEDKRWDLAEPEYRALVEADPKDHEARFWLGQSILGQRPSPDRRAEACQALSLALDIEDAEKKAAFARAHKAARCP